MRWNLVGIQQGLMGIAEAGLFFLFMNKQKPARRKGWLWSCFLLLAAVYIPLQITIARPMVDLVLRLLAGVVFVRFLYRLPWKRATFLCVLFYLAVGVSKSLLSRPILLGFAPTLLGLIDSHPLGRWGQTLAIIGLEALVVWICTRFISVEKQEDTPTLQLLTALLSCGTYMVTRQVLRGYSADNSALGGWEITVSMMALCVGTLLLTLFSEYYFISLRRKAEIRKLEVLLQAQYSNYLERQEADNAVRQMYHDIRNHLNCIRGMAPGSQVETYVEDICRGIAQHERFFKTGNNVLDIILRDKTLTAERCGISLQVYTNFETMDFMDAMDICAIFANALDNAIEAAQKLSMEGERTIRIKILTKSNCLVVKVTNPYETEPIMENGRLLTSKADKENHGLGLASLEHSLNKYGGEWEVQAEAGIFCLTILIPIPAAAE